MKTYARIDNGAIAELLTTDQNIAALFFPALVWLDVTGTSSQVGWLRQGNGFVAPPPLAATLVTPTLANLQAQLAALSAQIAAFQPQA